MESDLREISSIDALNLAREVKTKILKGAEAEGVLDRFVDAHWLRKANHNEVFILAPRFIAEMEPYLKEQFGDAVKNCPMPHCGKIVMRVSLPATFVLATCPHIGATT